MKQLKLDMKTEETTKKKLYIVVDNSSTRFLPQPLNMGEIVEDVSDENTPEGYLKVKHHKQTSTFSRHRFKRYIPKTK